MKCGVALAVVVTASVAWGHAPQTLEVRAVSGEKGDRLILLSHHLSLCAGFVPDGEVGQRSLARKKNWTRRCLVLFSREISSRLHTAGKKLATEWVGSECGAPASPQPVECRHTFRVNVAFDVLELELAADPVFPVSLVHASVEKSGVAHGSD